MSKLKSLVNWATGFVDINVIVKRLDFFFPLISGNLRKEEISGDNLKHRSCSTEADHFNRTGLC